MDRRPKSIRKKTVSMVDNHLSKQKSVYDRWIVELCRDADDSADERDRLKTKLHVLKEDQKRKVMVKILKRLLNAQYFRAWSCWYEVTVKMHQRLVAAEIKDLRAEVEEQTKDAERIEAEVETRTQEARTARLRTATESQRRLVAKILTKLCQGLARLAWTQWAGQSTARKQQRQLMVKILKRLYRAQLSKGMTRWNVITKKSLLINKLERKAALEKELADLDTKAQHFGAEIRKRQDDARNAAILASSRAQKDLIVKILRKMCNSFLLMGWAVWKAKWLNYRRDSALLTKVLSRLVNIKLHAALRFWHLVIFSLATNKSKVKQMLLRSQRDKLLETLRERAEQLQKLQAEALGLARASKENAISATAVKAASGHFADHLLLLIDRKIAEGLVEPPEKNNADRSPVPPVSPSHAYSDFRTPQTSPRPRVTSPGNFAHSVLLPPSLSAEGARHELLAFIFELEQRGHIRPDDVGASLSAPRAPSVSLASRNIPGRETWPEPRDSYLVPELAKVESVSRPPAASPASKQQQQHDAMSVARTSAIRSRLEPLLRPLAMAGDARLYSAMKTYRSTNNIVDFWDTLENLHALA
ncbi:hypothetical protein CTAYLR_007095 [Chrysophaeum taylorii]|uniref:Uncharacterized protein n=1 Tax=Chrysophaeum taylorii TaxID=2483200 RepID=A0AAD7UK68_9STRA|nr:hypothetical protein CTAYLR_007095 [Chrysophaeum taylorii]